MDIYGSDAEKIKELAANNPEWNEKLHPDSPIIKAEVIWVVRNEMAITIEDVLARRIRILFLDAKKAIDMAPTVATLMANELNLDTNWQKKQLKSFIALAQNYLTEPYLPKFEDPQNSRTPKFKI